MTKCGAANDVTLSQSVLSELMPLHILIDTSGKLLGAGKTALRLLEKDTENLDDTLALIRPAYASSMVERLIHAAQTGQGIEMRVKDASQVKLRGHVVRTANGNLLLDLGFGMYLHEAIKKLDLNESHFSPSSQIIEYMFLHEANRGVLRELLLFNTRLKGAHEVAEVQAHTDALTGLQNRRGLLMVLESVLAKIVNAENADDRWLAIGKIDLDHFKLVNDRLGHAAGDKVLCHAAQVLCDVTRSGDTVGRIGGDEFVLILRGINCKKTLHDLGGRIIKGIENTVEYQGKPCQVSASVGFALMKEPDNLHIEKLLEEADDALYSSKRNGRGRATIRYVSNTGEKALPADDKATLGCDGIENWQSFRVPIDRYNDNDISNRSSGHVYRFAWREL